MIVTISIIAIVVSCIILAGVQFALLCVAANKETEVDRWRKVTPIRTVKVRFRAELAEARRHAKVLAKACCGLMNNGKPDCKDHELRDALIHVKGSP